MMNQGDEGRSQILPANYEDIVVPKNSGVAIVIAAFVFFIGFGTVWHIWWLAGFGLIGAIVGILVRGFTEETERVIPAEEVARTEEGLRARYASP